MSDPVSSMDVEDVLSSIRRLVSEESKTADSSRESMVKRMNETPDQTSKSLEDSVASMFGRTADQATRAKKPDGVPPSNEDIADTGMDDTGDDIAPHPTDEKKAASDSDEQKLVLTAALRVKDSDSGSDEKVLPIRPIRPVRPERLHLRSVQGEPDPETPEASGSTTAQRPRGRAFEAAPDELLFDRANREIEAARQNRPVEPAKPVNPAAFNQPKWAEPEIEPEAAVPDPIEPHEFGNDVTAAGDEDTPEPAKSEASPFRKEGGVFGKRLVAEPVYQEAEPDDSAATTADESHPAFQADAPETDPFMAHPDEADPDEPSTINFAEQDENILDEDALRDLVSQMVREELQGELGDRITRNVRKLVRREIQRALASREFE